MLLSRFALTSARAVRWFDPAERAKATAAKVTDLEILKNPYRMSEVDLGDWDDSLLLPAILEGIEVATDPMAPGDLPVDRGSKRSLYDGRRYHYYSKHTVNPIIPRRAANIGIMHVPTRLLPFTFLWQASCEDGVFPGDEPGPFEATLQDDEDC